LRSWHAQSPEALRDVSAVIHDAYLDVDEVHYDQAGRCIRIPFAQDWGRLVNDDEPAQAGPRAELTRRTWRYVETRVPFVRGVLCVRHVSSFAADANAGDASMLLGIRYDAGAGRVTIDGASGDLTALVDQLDVAAEVRPEEIAAHVLRRHGRIGSSETPLW
jgi:hypothetical protein